MAQQYAVRSENAMGPVPSTTHHHLTHEARRELTDELIRAATSSPEDREQLLAQVVVINVRVAHAVAHRYRNRGVPVDDLEQVACEALVKAVHRFDPTQRHDLLTYAVPTIRGEVLRYFRDHSWTVRPPRRVQDLQWRINQAIDEFTVDLGREPTAVELQERLAVSRQDYDEAVAAFGCFQPTSLDRLVDPGSDLRLGDALTDESDAPTKDAVEARVMLGSLIKRLSARDRLVLHLRYVEDRSQQQIGEELGLSQAQVSRWLGRLLKEMREQLVPDGVTPGQAA